jgi:hypothetical protein
MLVWILFGVFFSGCFTLFFRRPRIFAHIMCSIIAMKISMLFRAIFRPQNLSRFKDGMFVVHYNIGKETYSIPIHINVETRQIEKISDQEGNDITKIVLPFLGPNLDCHLLHITPKLFDKTGISIRFTDIYEETYVRTFGINDDISL